MTEDGGAVASVVYLPGEITLEDYWDILTVLDDQVEDLEEYYINGQPWLVYFMPENDGMNVATVIEGKGLVEVTFAPMSDEDFAAYAEIMAISLRLK